MVNFARAASYCIGSLIFLSACSTTLEVNQLRQSLDLSSYKRVEINDVPFYAQEEYQCGPAALAMLLDWSGVSVTPQELVPLVYVPERQGSFQLEMVAATRFYNRIPYTLKPDFQSLIDELEAGHPVLVFQNLGLDWIPRWHYAVVYGIDLANNEIILHSGTVERHVLALDTFERTWQRTDKWAMVLMPPDKLPASAEPLPYIKAISYFETNGKLELARQAYQAAVERWPESLLTLMGMGNVNYRLQQLSQAQQFYQKAIEINSEYAPAHNNLAQVLMEQGELKLAREHARAAVHLGGEHAENYQDTLSQINRRLTEPDN